MSAKRFKQSTIGFLSPMTPNGYDLIRLFGKKFSTVIPMWFSITVDPYADDPFRPFKIEGFNTVDLQWIQKIRERHKKLDISPRVAISEWDKKSLTAMLMSFCLMVISLPTSATTML